MCPPPSLAIGGMKPGWATGMFEEEDECPLWRPG
eukprot:CAMPEP_0170506358 /NCGR_PEP_ID=MMETSP0208-20121228/54604_1 /TAXON_ID=197538 /ORGANISM="Strombidium inclinatum, Strain S3" /LENGTH=33 /DNA_ID= /DNA_START= /DNA_END= /DNA_ORIENTATION=